MTEVKRLFDVPSYQLEHFPNEKMFNSKINGNWESISTKDFVATCNNYSLALLSLGIKVGECVGIVSNNRLEWNIMDIAIQQIGAIVVPVYPNISANDYVYIFNDAEIRYAFVGSEELYTKISGVKANIPRLEKMFCFDQEDGIDHFSTILTPSSESAMEKLHTLKAAVRNEEMATIIYTSGTTGNPKGVMLSHNNILSNVVSCRKVIPADEKSRVLTFLPACHSYERMLHYLYMYCGSQVYYAESMETIGDNIREVKPHVFTAVPRLLEKVFDRIMTKGDELKGLKRKLFFWSVALGEKYDVSKKGSLGYNFKLSIARKLIFSKWREALGGEVRAIASGSAALQPRLAQIFLAANIQILEGYGLTETSPVISVNTLEKDGIRIGCVGPLIDDVKVKIAEDGEILVKGPNVMLGYYKLPDKTAEVMDADGWFHTGDIGTFVENKFLKITDRKKEIFKTSGGKYIVPQLLENKFKESRFIEQIMIVGENQKFPSAFIVPNFAYVREWCRESKISLEGISNADLVKLPQVIKRIDQEVANFNKEFGNFEQLKRVALLPAEFGIESGELTPTLKLKRKIILEKNHVFFDQIYNVD